MPVGDPNAPSVPTGWISTLDQTDVATEATEPLRLCDQREVRAVAVRVAEQGDAQPDRFPLVDW